MELRIGSELPRNNHLLKSLEEHGAEDISMLIRHAPRHRIPEGVIEHHDIPLTSRGRVMAYEFGEKLPDDVPVRLFYSPIPRCKETAECMREGVISNSGSAVLMGERDFLDTHAIVDLGRMVRMMEETGGLEFIRKWLDGEIERAIMNEPHQVVSRIAEGVIASKREKENNRRTIDIHVTHDVNIVSAREILLGVRLENAGWPDYLDGFLFVHYPDSIAVKWQSCSKTIRI